jgi:hypothetical protein
VKVCTEIVAMNGEPANWQRVRGVQVHEVLRRLAFLVQGPQRQSPLAAGQHSPRDAAGHDEDDEDDDEAVKVRYQRTPSRAP